MKKTFISLMVGLGCVCMAQWVHADPPEILPLGIKADLDVTLVQPVQYSLSLDKTSVKMKFGEQSEPLNWFVYANAPWELKVSRTPIKRVTDGLELSEWDLAYLASDGDQMCNPEMEICMHGEIPLSRLTPIPVGPINSETIAAGYMSARRDFTLLNPGKYRAMDITPPAGEYATTVTFLLQPVY